MIEHVVTWGLGLPILLAFTAFWALALFAVSELIEFSLRGILPGLVHRFR